MSSLIYMSDGCTCYTHLLDLASKSFYFLIILFSYSNVKTNKAVSAC